MKRVYWEDNKGYKHCSLLRDTDNEEYPQFGIPCDPPNLDKILDESKKMLHNELVSRGLCTYADIQNAQSGLSNAILSVLKNNILYAYRDKDREKQGGSNG